MIEVVSVAGLATVQDEGRPGHMHEGVPPGGPLVPELLSRANTAAQNSSAEAAIEVLGSITITAHVCATVAADDGQSRVLQRGETWTLRGLNGCARYLAVRGGIDVPRVLGGRGTLLVAHLGGHEGRSLRRGDVLRVGGAAPQDGIFVATPDTHAPVAVVLGPDLDRFDPRTVDAFLTATFIVDVRSDRIGTRLAGPRLPCEDDPSAASAPMVRGAVQVTPSGEPIVLGPDHPTTGGYPVIATVKRPHLGSLAARPMGAAVKFTL